MNIFKNIFGFLKRSESPAVEIARAERVNYPKHLNDLARLGKNHGWRVKSYFEDTSAMVFIPKEPSEHKNMVVYTTKMTVSTAMKHPTKGNTQLYRKDVTMKEMEKLFANPRAHTNKGYYVKRKK